MSSGYPMEDAPHSGRLSLSFRFSADGSLRPSARRAFINTARPVAPTGIAVLPAVADPIARANSSFPSLSLTPAITQALSLKTPALAAEHAPHERLLLPGDALAMAASRLVAASAPDRSPPTARRRATKCSRARRRASHPMKRRSPPSSPIPRCRLFPRSMRPPPARRSNRSSRVGSR